MTYSRFFLLLPLLVLLTGAKVYKWVDENGQVHFGTQPPPRQMEKVEDTGLGKTADSNPSTEVEEVIENRWWANTGSKVIQLQVASYGYSWSEYSGSQKPERHSGEWKLTYSSLALTSKTGVARKFAVKEARAYSLSLLDVSTEERFDFKRLREERYDLSGREEEISGDWAQVSAANSNQVIARLRLENGIFQRYYVSSRSELIDAHPNPNMVNARGQWRIVDDTLILEYIEAYEELWKLAASEQEWRIDSLDYRNLKLTHSATREVMHFRRKRKD